MERHNIRTDEAVGQIFVANTGGEITGLCCPHKSEKGNLEMSAKTLAALEKATMRRYFQLSKKYPVEFAKIIAGDDLDYDKNAVALVRACAAHVKSKKAKR